VTEAFALHLREDFFDGVVELERSLSLRLRAWEDVVKRLNYVYN